MSFQNISTTRCISPTFIAVSQLTECVYPESYPQVQLDFEEGYSASNVASNIAIPSTFYSYDFALRPYEFVCNHFSSQQLSNDQLITLYQNLQQVASQNGDVQVFDKSLSSLRQLSIFNDFEGPFINSLISNIIYNNHIHLLHLLQRLQQATKSKNSATMFTNEHVKVALQSLNEDVFQYFIFDCQLALPSMNEAITLLGFGLLTFIKSWLSTPSNKPINTSIDIETHEPFRRISSVIKRIVDFYCSQKLESRQFLSIEVLQPFISVGFTSVVKQLYALVSLNHTCSSRFFSMLLLQMREFDGDNTLQFLFSQLKLMMPIYFSGPNSVKFYSDLSAFQHGLWCNKWYSKFEYSATCFNYISAFVIDKLLFQAQVCLKPMNVEKVKESHLSIFWLTNIFCNCYGIVNQQLSSRAPQIFYILDQVANLYNHQIFQLLQVKQQLYATYSFLSTHSGTSNVQQAFYSSPLYQSLFSMHENVLVSLSTDFAFYNLHWRPRFHLFLHLLFHTDELKNKYTHLAYMLYMYECQKIDTLKVVSEVPECSKICSDVLKIIGDFML